MKDETKNDNMARRIGRSLTGCGKVEERRKEVCGGWSTRGVDGGKGGKHREGTVRSIWWSRVAGWKLGRVG